jgi:hypothetical protein
LELYFAYGSNLKLARLRERAPSARAGGRALLSGWRLAFDKPGRDGSAKANLRREVGSLVWGALYALAPGDWPRLDAAEPGYERIRVEVAIEGGEIVRAQTYAARARARDQLPLEGYLRLVLEGAREHGLPADWVAALERLGAGGGGRAAPGD